MILLTLLTDVVQAGELGFRLDISPNSYEETRHVSTLHWTPWIRWNNEAWVFKGNLGIDGEYTQSKTADTTTYSRQSRVLVGGEVEKRIPTKHPSGDTAEWLIGFGIQGNVPFLSQYSSLYTSTEQQDVDAQLQNQFAEQAYTAFSVPITFMIPLQDQLFVGLGARGTYKIRRTSSDFETTYSSEMTLIPMLTFEGRSN